MWKKVIQCTSFIIHHYYVMWNFCILNQHPLNTNC